MENSYKSNRPIKSPIGVGQRKQYCKSWASLQQLTSCKVLCPHVEPCRTEVFESERVANLLARMRKIVAFFHRSNIAAHLLKTKAEGLALPQHKLVIDVCTRWNSAYDMISRFLEMPVAVFAVLRSKNVGRDH